MKAPFAPLGKKNAFTLVEMLVSVSVLALIMLVLVSMTNQISQTWRSTTGKIEQFQGARDGFESMTRKISQATLNTYWDLYNVKVGGRDSPRDFLRQSQLRFVSGPMAKLAPDPTRPTHGIFFQAPLGFVDDVEDLGRLDNLLNTWGYFLEVGEDETYRPSFLTGLVPSHTKPRLMELMQPAESLSVYDLDPKGADKPVPGDQLGWFRPSLTGTNRPVRVLAENVVALIVWPRLSKLQEDARRDAGRSVLSPNYVYDSSVRSFFKKITSSATSIVYLNEGTAAVDSVTTNPQIAGEINPFNQLPPVVQVTMVAVDDASAQRLVAASPMKKGAFADLTKGLFEVACVTGTKANQETKYEQDLKELEERIVKAKLTYRVFSTNVTIRGAKWSSYQTRSRED